MSYILGIDLGTTNCTVTSVDHEGRRQILPNRDGEILTPSAVYFNSEPNSVVVGKRAKELARTDPRSLVLFVKREMGKTKDAVRYDPVERRSEPYQFWGRILSPEEISAYILVQLKKDAETFLKTTITEAVITCPAYFGSKEKEATRLAGEIAGFKVLEIIPEPTAAALSYDAVTDSHQETIFVFDLGGGTLDVTVLTVSDGPKGRDVRTLATNGNRKLGGKDWDDYLIGYLVDRFNSTHHIDLDFEEGPAKDVALGKLRLDVEAAKIELSSSPSVSLSLEYGGGRIDEVLTPAKFEDISASLVTGCQAYCNNALKDADKSWADIDTVVMVGSMSRSPALQKALVAWSGKPVRFGVVDPKTCVSDGAAILGHSLKGGSHPSVSVVPYSLGIVARNAQGEPVVAKLIAKNTQYPVSFPRTFPLGFDNMSTLDIKVVEGESPKPEECDQLGLLSMGLNGRLAKGDKIEVTLAVDANGILQATALDLKTGLKVETTIRRDGALTKSEIADSIDAADMLTLG